MDRTTAGGPIKHGERTGSALEVLRVFAKLGVSCFGGPIAHIGYFRQEFVVRRHWLDEHAYADLVSLGFGFAVLQQPHPPMKGTSQCRFLGRQASLRLPCSSCSS